MALAAPPLHLVLTTNPTVPNGGLDCLWTLSSLTEQVGQRLGGHSDQTPVSQLQAQTLTQWPLKESSRMSARCRLSINRDNHVQGLDARPIGRRTRQHLKHLKS